MVNIIKKIIVDGLNSKISGEYPFHPDINVLTGKNGAGKTNFLKLIWYLTSGHIQMVLSDIDVRYVELHGDDYRLIINNKNNSENYLFEKDEPDDNETAEITFYSKNEKLIETKVHRVFSRGPRKSKLETLHEFIEDKTNKSVFFPTFRRIEYALNDSEYSRYGRNSVTHLAEYLTTKNHVFVTAISTKDIVELVSSEFAKISNEIVKMNMDFSEQIRNEVKVYRNTSLRKNTMDENEVLLKNATSALNKITDSLDKYENYRKKLLTPFNQLDSFISDVFDDKGIRFTDDIKLGVGDAMLSDKLSAGEQQMLSFLCYNAFMDNSTIFIDEPELSLHVDWQRDLFPILMNQGKNNQYFVATHSPFIYSKYETNEIVLSESKGW